MRGINGASLFDFPDNLYNDLQYFDESRFDETAAFGTHVRDRKRSQWNNVRLIVESIVDAVDPPRFMDKIGLVRVHRAQYKITIFASSLIAHPATDPGNPCVNGEEAVTLFFDCDHLHVSVWTECRLVLYRSRSMGSRAAAGRLPLTLSMNF